MDRLFSIEGFGMTEIVDMTNAAELDAFVERHPRCHFMQTSLYGRFRTDRTWTGIICRDRNRTIRGTMALLRHTTHHFNLSFFYAPRGPIFDDGDLATFRELIEAARQLAKQCGTYMLRVDPAIEETDAAFLQCAQELGFRRKDAVDYSMSQPRMCYISDLAGLDTESLLMHYSRMKRYDVRRAMRNGVTVRMGSVEDVPVFNRMMEATAEKKGFTPRSAEYFSRFLTNLGEGAQMYLAEKDGKVIAGAITMEYGNCMWHMFGCSDREYHADCPNELLQYAMQCHAIQNGRRWFDFYGVEGYPVEENPKYGLHKYKQGFGAQFHAYAGEFDLPIRPLVERIMRLRQS